MGWVTLRSSGKKMPMDLQAVEPATHGAFLVIAGEAYTLAEARDRIMRSRNIINPTEADQVACAEFRWYTSHFATCPAAAEKRKDR